MTSDFQVDEVGMKGPLGIYIGQTAGFPMR
jgi:hypothetical protein